MSPEDDSEAHAEWLEPVTLRGWLRRRLQSGWIRALAVLATVSLLLTVILGTITLVGDVWGWLEPQARPDPDADLNRALPKSETPVPGSDSETLGFGDADGGRPVLVYNAQTPVPTTPTFNSFVDLPYGTGDEREFLRVAHVTDAALIPELAKASDWDRRQTVRPKELVVVRVTIDNNAVAPPSCAAPEGPEVAENTRVRVAVTDSSSHERHVVRTWISANNSSPLWITDAVVVHSGSNAVLSFDSASSSIYARFPPGVPTTVTQDVMSPAGLSIGLGGKIGGCWDNRLYVILAFRVS